MAKITLNDVASGYNRQKINDNFTDIEAEFQNKVLYRDNPTGEPNQMEQELDMNSNTIYNLPDAINGSEAVPLSQLNRQLQASSSGLIARLRETRKTATADQTVINLADITYTLGVNNLQVYVNGVAQVAGVDYLETDTTTITFTSGLEAGDVIDIYANDATTNTVADAQNVTYGQSSNVDEALNNRTVFVGSVAELEALPGPVAGQEALVSGVPFKYDGSDWYPSAGFVTFRAYGAVGSGDETTEIAACIAAAASAKARILDYTGKTYSYSSIISTPYFDYDGNSSFVGSSGAYFYILGQGFPDEIGEVTAAASKGDYTVTVSDTTGLSPGRIIILENTVDESFSQHRPFYHDGEFNVVKSVTPTEITVENPLQSNYPAAVTMKVYSATFGSMRTKGGRFTSDAAFALRARLCSGVRMQDTYCEAVGADRASSLVIDRCYDAELKGVSTRLDFIASGSGNYGLSIANSNDVIVWGGNFHGGRHAITTGGSSDTGAAPCRHVKIIKATLANDPASSIYNADFHGNTADSYYEGCTIYGSAGIAGENVACRNSVVYGRPGAAPLDLHEVVGGDIDYSGCTVVTDGAARVIGFSSSTLANNIDRDYAIIADDLNVEIDSSCVNIANFFIGATVNSRFSMVGLRWSGDFSGLTYVQNFSIQPGATKPASVRLDNVDADISTITGWVSGLATSTGTLVTMPKLSKTEALGLLLGNSESTSGGTSGENIFTFPAYPVIPTIEAHSDGNANLGGGYAFPVISFNSTVSEARGKMVMGNDATTAASTGSFRMTIKVGLDGMII